MFSNLASKLFQFQIYDEDLAKQMVLNYARKLAPSLTDQEILLIIYEYDGQYSFENIMIQAVRKKKRSGENSER